MNWTLPITLSLGLGFALYGWHANDKGVYFFGGGIITAIIIVWCI